MNQDRELFIAMFVIMGMTWAALGVPQSPSDITLCIIGHCILFWQLIRWIVSACSEGATR